MNTVTALARGKLGRSDLPDMVLLNLIWNSGRNHFPIYSVANIALSNLVSLTSCKNLHNFSLFPGT